MTDDIFCLYKMTIIVYSNCHVFEYVVFTLFKSQVNEKGRRHNNLVQQFQVHVRYGIFLAG